MSDRNSQQPLSAPAGGGAPPPAALPDINAETYPFDTVVHLLDEAAYQNMFSIPAGGHSEPILGREGFGGVIGLKVKEHLHRFSIVMQPPTRSHVSTSNTIGEQVARFEHRWMFAPDGFPALPTREVPEIAFDSSRSQRFVMLDSICRFENGRDGFRGFGTGRTYPTHVNGQTQLLAGAVGSILEGFGKFKGHEGTYTYCGTLSPQEGFRGNVLCRVVDPDGNLRTENSLPSLDPGPEPEPGITYLMFRGQKKNRNQKTEYNIGPDGQVAGLNVHQQLRQVLIDSADRGRGGPRSVISFGPTIGNMSAKILFNLLNPGAPGTALSPIPFKSYNQYAFTDQQGRDVGVVEADGGEGRTFNLTLVGAPGQKALRFGGVGPIVKGSGLFEGMQGLMADNSVVGVAPHALSTLYVLRVNDPDGKYRHA
ncbi:MAG TPA: hypothetical protein VI685_26775 [Candidatus Angelobacter sp.]